MAGDNNGIADVFVCDLETGVTTLVSAGAIASTSPGGGSSESPDITPDGRYIAFYSTAANVAPGASNSPSLYIRDVTSATTTWASSYALAAVRLLKPSATTVVSYNHVLSTNGQFVAYQASSASGAPDAVILRYDLLTGLTDLLSTNASMGTAIPEDLRTVDMTPTGRFIAFVATNRMGSMSSCIYVWDAQAGTTTVASVDLSNSVPSRSICDWPRLDASGRFVLFLSSATNLVTNSLAGDCHLYLRDMQAGTTTLVDADTNGIGSALSLPSAPQISADGRFVIFECLDAGLVPNDRNRGYDVFVRDVVGGATEMISARDAILPTETPNGASALSAYSVSADGSYVAFASEADNLVSGDTNGWRDIFVCDPLRVTNVLVSVGTHGIGADGMSMEPAISGDGRYVAFTSSADNLVPGDANLARDVFVRDLQAGTTVLVSANNIGTGSGNGASYSPSISADGRYVLFCSLAQNLAAGSFTSGYENLFVRDLQRGTNYALTHTTSGTPVGAMTPDGRVVAFYGIVPGYAAKLYVWNSQSASLVYSNALTGIVNVAISPDGNRIAYSTSSTLSGLDRVSATSWTIGSLASTAHAGPGFSGDGRFLVYVTKVSGTNQVCLYDLQYNTNFLVSHSYDSSAGAYGSSDWPEIGSDGRFLAYHGAAANIVVGDTNGVPDVFLYDRLNNVTTLLSANRFGTAAGDSRSLAPVFSGDGQTLVFESWGSDLAAQDFNQSSDLFACRLYISGQIPLFSVAILPGTRPGQGPWLAWPVVPGKNYGVEFKNTVHDPEGQTLNGGVTILGNRAYLNDLSAGASQRFYRVVAY